MKNRKIILLLFLLLLLCLAQLYWIDNIFLEGRIFHSTKSIVSQFQVGETTFLGLSSVPEEDIQSFISEKQFTATDLSYKINFGGMTMLQNQVTQEYFLSINRDKPQNTTEEFTSDDNLQLFWIGDVTLAEERIANNESFTMIAIENKNYQILSLKLTTLPILSIQSAEIPTQEDEIGVSGSLAIFGCGEEKNLQVSDFIDVPDNFYELEYCVSKSSAPTYPKESYKVSIKEKDGSTLSTSLLGLRQESDWELTAHYTDLSKIREASVLSLYNELANSEEIPYLHPQNAQFCELFINGIYWGIYQLTEPMNVAQVEIKESADILYKATSWELPSIEELVKNNNNGTENPLLELENVPESIEAPYSLLFPYLSILTNPETTLQDLEEVIHIDNVIDLCVLRSILALVDNDLKNMVYVARIEGDNYKISKEYYDFNYSLGDTWDSNAWGHTGELLPSDPVFTALFPRELHEETYWDVIDLYVSRYEDLRLSVFSSQNIKSHIQLHYDTISGSGAYHRDALEWGIDVDFQMELDYMMWFVEEHLYATDLFVEDLKNQKNKN